MPKDQELSPKRPILKGFEVLEEIGSGGMGVVYRAKHLRLRRLVAVKVLHPEKVADLERKKRFLREARAASALAHPGIVIVHDLVSTGDQDALVMELVDGKPLNEFLREGPLPWREAVEIATDLGHALSAAHAGGIVHRDLKPSNVMLTEHATSAEDRGGSRVKLLDFGIAKLERAFDDTGKTRSDTFLTGDSSSPGTLAYMSPEQALGETVDHRSDIFSFGILLYEMVTGTRPFQGPTSAALAHQLIFAAPDPAEALVDDLPKRLGQIIQRALAKAPRDRYQEMAALCADLRSLDAPRVESQTEASSRPRPLGRPLFWLPILVALAALGLWLGAPWVTTQIESSETELGAEATPSPVVSNLPRTPFQHYETGKLRLQRFDRKGYVDSAIDDFEAALEEAPDYAPAWHGLAQASLQKFISGRDALWLQRAAQYAGEALELNPSLLDAKITSARIRALEGDPRGARSDLLELLELNPQNPAAWAALAEAAFQLKELKTATEHLEKAIELSPEDWILRAEHGKYFMALGDFSAAESAFRGAIEIAPDNALLRHNLGAILHYQGRFPEAVEELQESITISPSARGYTNLGTAYFFQGLFREAAKALEAARDLGANYYIFWSNLGDVYRQIPGKDEDAIRCFQRAIQLLRREIEKRPLDAKLQSQLATYLVKAGDPQSALIEVERLGPLHAQPGHVAFRATLVYELAGQRKEALSALANALEADYPLVEVLNEPEFVNLRKDVAFHELAMRFDLPASP